MDERLLWDLVIGYDENMQVEKLFVIVFFLLVISIQLEIHFKKKSVFHYILT